MRSRYVAIALITVLTLGIVGAVVLTTTSVGCSPANALGIKTARCLKAGTVASVGAIPSPSPHGGSRATPTVPNNFTPPTNPGASNYPPYNPGASSYPPYNPGASAGTPYANPASSPYPPMANPASGSSAGFLGISCRLPVYAGGPGSGGFIVFPGATFVADPRSAVTAPSPSTGPSPTPPPIGGYVGWWGTTYDAAYSKWLPVPYAWVSPDGAHYAYPLNGDVFVQSVAGGAQLDLGQGRQYSVVEVENNGAYVTVPNQPGLWFLPFSGAARQVTAAGFWQAVSNGAAYGTATAAVPQGATTTILKLDTTSGVATEFFSQGGGQSGVTGFDLQGHPVIQVYYPQGTALFLATGPGSSMVLAVNGFGQYNPGPFPQGQLVADSHGLWFYVGSGVVLYANGAWYAMSNIGGQPAGQCL